MPNPTINKEVKRWDTWFYEKSTLELDNFMIFLASENTSFRDQGNHFRVLQPEEIKISVKTIPHLARLEREEPGKLVEILLTTGD